MRFPLTRERFHEVAQRSPEALYRMMRTAWREHDCRAFQSPPPEPPRPRRRASAPVDPEHTIAQARAIWAALVDLEPTPRDVAQARAREWLRP